MTEAELERLIAERCAQLGLLVQHFEGAYRAWLPGWPDLTIIGTRTLYRELKSAGGVVKPDQARCGRRITRAGGDFAVWRPEHWYNGLILRQLQEIRATR